MSVIQNIFYCFIGGIDYTEKAFKFFFSNGINTMSNPIFKENVAAIKKPTREHSERMLNIEICCDCALRDLLS